MRIFRHNKIFFLGEQSYLDGIKIASEYIAQSWKVDLIIGIAEGGKILMRDLSSQLKTKSLLVKILANVNNSIRSKTLVTPIIVNPDILQDLNGRYILIVDDICGSGSTLTTLKRHIELEFDVREIKTFTICKNIGSNLNPNLYLWTVSDWVVFFWEENKIAWNMTRLEQPKLNIL